MTVKVNIVFGALLVALIITWLPLSASQADVEMEVFMQATLSPPSAAATDKIAPDVLRMVEEKPGEKVRIIVIMAQQADLSSQVMFRGMAEGGLEQQRQAIYQKLVDTANNTQGPVLAVLQGLRGGGVNAQSANDEVISYWIFNGLAAAADRETILKLASMPEVQYIYNDEIIQIPVDELVPSTTDPIGSAGQMSWGVAKIRADRVWSEFGFNGKGVVVGVIDSGVDPTHPALKDKYRGNHTYQVYSWRDYVADQLRPYDDLGHGTHVTGIILGDDGLGNQIGVAPGAEWIAAKVLDAHGRAHARSILRAMQWMMAPDGVPRLAAQVVNNSWGGPCGPEYFRLALQSWRAAGIVPIFSAGNYGPSEKSVGQPGCLPEAIAVGATDSNDVITSFSSRGPSPYGEIKPELTAPGDNIRSSMLGGIYATYRGTSMSAPHVTGLVALLRQAYPNMTVDEIETVLKNTAVDLGPAGADNSYGWGRVDAYLALGGSEDQVPPAAATLISPQGPISETQPDFIWYTVSDASAYQLQVNQLGGPSISLSYPAAQICTASTCTARLTSPLTAFAYTWQVQASNAAGAGPWSSLMSFTVRQQTATSPAISPTATATSPVNPTATPTPVQSLLPGEVVPVWPQGNIYDVYPIYTWRLVSNATRYQLQVSGTTGEVLKRWYQASDACSSSNCSVKPARGLEPGAYLFQVQAGNNVGEGPWSTALNFVVLSSQPASPSPTLPKSPTPLPPFTLTPTSSGYDTYVVQPGDYLAKLAQQWGISWLELANLNNISYPYVIYPGQVLKKPRNPQPATPSPVATAQPTQPTAGPPLPTPTSATGWETYIVKPGDYLIKLATQWGVSWQDLAAWNNLSYPYTIYVGQVLKKPASVSIPTAPPGPSSTPTISSGRTYIVQPGDFLIKLATQWGVSWVAVAELNNLRYPYVIYPGQVLKIP